MDCKNCQEPIGAGVSFCPYCGTKVVHQTRGKELHSPQDFPLSPRDTIVAANSFVYKGHLYFLDRWRKKAVGYSAKLMKLDPATQEITCELDFVAQK